MTELLVKDSFPKMNFRLVITWCIAFSVAAGHFLNISDIRLVDGSGPYGGRVEIKINGIWGTVCDDSFDFDDATVMCRMMNLKASTYMTGAWYGRGKGPIFAQKFECRRYHTHLKNCTYVPNVQCTHARDIGIICSECPQISINNGNATDISADGTVLSAMCNDGLRSNNLRSYCSNGTWSPTISCRRGYDITDIRLANGTGLYDGRVELLINGTWGTICSTEFSWSEVIAICNILFGSKFTSVHHQKYYRTSTTYGPGKGPIYLDRLSCDESATNIGKCSYSLNVSCTDHTRDIAIGCYVYPLKNFTATRLVNGTGPYDGRIEVYLDGYWGTICNRHINTFDAQTICNTHNASLAMFFTESIYGKGTGPVLIGDMNCFSNRQLLNNCIIYAPYRPDCSHDYDLSIVCTSCGLPKIYNGEAVSFNYNELTVKCQKGFFPDFIKMQCLDNGTWSENQRCTYNAYPLNISEIRLKDVFRFWDSNDFSNEGRVEIFVNGTWGTVCNTDFDSKDGAVLCRMLDLEYKDEIPGYRYFHYADIFGIEDIETIFVDRLNCNGTEKHINNCTYEISNYCTHYDDVAILCTGSKLNITDIRLAGTNGPFHGRVEIEVDGVWGTVCHENLFTPEAKVVCRMLGLEYNQFYLFSKYGPGSGPIYLEGLSCTSLESHISDCVYGLKYDYNCNHGKDASVMCYGPRLRITDARLANGNGPYDGRAEIEVDSTWGTICDENFSILDADYFCKMLGLRAAKFYTRAFYGKGSGPVFIDQLLCDTNDYDLRSCKYLFLNECTHERDVSVVCKGPRLNITGARLANGNGPYDGRAEIKVDSTWGTICDENFSILDADYFCKMLGLRAAKFYTGAFYGKGSGPVFIDQLLCDTNDYDLRSCKYLFLSKCTHERDVSVVCKGPRLNITDARLANGNGSYDGRAEIKVDSTWGTICDENFSILDADYFCKMLGLRADKFYTGAFYGKGSGPVFIDQLLCDTNAYDLKSCEYLFLNECTHERDVSVVCKECGQPDISYWDAGFFTYNGSTPYADCSFYKTYIGTLKLTCDNKTQTWVTEGECQEYSFPLNITDIRLADGSRPSHGRVEIKSLNTWGTLCDDNFGMSEANLICKMVGYTRAVGFRTNAFYGEGKGPIFIDDFDCKDNAFGFSDCTYKTFDDCTHSEDISVVCIECRDPTPEHGLIYTSSTSYQSAVHVTCEKNYELIGEENIFCQPNGIWSSRPVCKPIDCGDPAPLHGSSNSSVTLNGTVVLVECDKGYNIIGEAIITCQPNETWTDKPSCAIIDCGVPKPENADAILLRNKTTYGEAAVISCWRGYRSSGTTTVTCLSNGTWEVWDQCNLIDCGVPKPENADAMLLGNKTTYGEKAIISCWKGYRSSTTTTVSCLANGTWEVWAQCNLIDCGNPVPANGYTNTTDTAYGTVVELTCKSGYSITGNSVIKCQEDGTWSDSPVCDISEKTDDDGTNKIFIIVAVCMGIAVVTIMGLVVVILRRKRDTSAKKIGESTDAAITEAETDLRYDNATQIHQTSPAREANPYESLRELRVNQSDYDMVMTPYEHYQTHNRNTAETEDTRCYQNLLLNK